MKKNPILVNAIYVYIFLFVVEGALRKWIFPGLATPLLVVRDPVVLLIYFYTIVQNRFPLNGYVASAAVMGLLSFVVSFILGQDNLVVTLFGIRANFLQIPMVFIIGHTLDKSNVYTVAKAFLIAAIPMTILIAAQFNVGPDHRLNVGIGGSGTSAITGALGKFRPSGTFSFVNGVVHFYTLTAALLMGLFLDKFKFPRWIIIPGALAVTIAVPLTISRTLVISIGIIVLFALYAMIRQKKTGAKLFKLLAGGAVSLLILSNLSIFSEGVDAFQSRWDEATTQRGGVSESILLRMYHDNIHPILNIFDYPFFGHGIGVGTNGGARMLTGERSFTLGEGEIQRVLGESGFLLGFAFIVLRLLLSFQVGALCNKLVSKNPVPIILFSAVALPFMIGQWGQSTSLGFAIMGMGLTIASMREPKASTKE